ncbi:MAG: LPS export ABC transporter periplasmic protein LptC [Sneathiella sp.]|nr:LPS export ABC transporter periplasmic protein LptC [Sneathiella sp.]
MEGPIATPPEREPKNRQEATFWQTEDRQINRAGEGRYTRFVSVMKWALPLLAGILLLIVFLLPALEDEVATISLEYLSVQNEDSQLTMTNPRFLSSDKGDQQYVITADSATQIDPPKRTVALKNLQADITLTDGQWISMSAPDGILDPDTKMLELTGGIEIFSDTGDQIYAPDLNADLNTKTFVSPTGLKGHGPLGDIEADRFVANQTEGTLRFEGNVKMTLYP